MLLKKEEDIKEKGVKNDKICLFVGFVYGNFGFVVSKVLKIYFRSIFDFSWGDWIVWSLRKLLYNLILFYF